MAEILGVDPATLSDWKLEEGFMDDVIHLAKRWARQFTPEVLHAMRDSATSVGQPGAPNDRKLWLQYIEKWSERVEHTGEGGGPVVFEFPGSKKPLNTKEDAGAPPLQAKT